jgi:hypothetical protein
MIDVTFCGESMQEIRAQMRDFLGHDPVKITVNAPDISATIKEKLSKEKSAEKAEPTPAPTAQPETAATPSYKDIADYIPKAVSKYGRGKIVTLLEGFGAKTGKELKSEQYGEVLTKLKAEYPL